MGVGVGVGWGEGRGGLKLLGEQMGAGWGRGSESVGFGVGIVYGWNG